MGINVSKKGRRQMNKKNFIEKCLDGEAKWNEIEKYIDEWNAKANQYSALGEYLGLTLREYHLYKKSGNNIIRQFIQIKRVVNTIENSDMKELAQKLMLTIPEYWYHVPASSSGKYHPEYSLGEGGLVRHTVALVRTLNYMFESSDEFNSRERDMLRIAGIMHDTRKSGSQTNYENYYETKHEHPLLAAEAVRTLKGSSDYNDNEIEIIAQTIESHMGKWTTSKYSDVVLPKPETRMQITLHQADYLASRKDILFTFTD